MLQNNLPFCSRSAFLPKIWQGGYMVSKDRENLPGTNSRFGKLHML